MSDSFPLGRLGEVLTKSEDWICIKPEERYKQVTVHLWGKGVTQRNEVSGAEIASKRQIIVHSQQFILSRIDARNGAFGIVPKSLEGAVVSSDFPVFNLNLSKIIPGFLEWICKTRNFIDICKAASEGTTNRVRLKGNSFLASEIPLPALDEQCRIVARIDGLAARIEEARKLRRRAVEETEVVLKSAIRRFIGEEPSEEWIPLNTFVSEIENGWSPSCETRPASENEWGVLKVGCVSFGFYNHNQNKALPSTLEPRPYCEVHPGDFLMSRANTLELVGACAIVKITRPKLMLSDKVFRFNFKKDTPIDHRFLDYVLKSPALRRQIQKGSTGTSPTMKNISKEKVLNLLIPSKEMKEQMHIAFILDDLQSKLDALKRHQAETAAELDALLPAVLERAFRGVL